MTLLIIYLASSKQLGITSIDKTALKQEKYWVACLVVFGCIGNYLVISGLEYLQIAVASLLNNTFPLFVIVVAFLAIGEKLNKRQLLIIIATLLGVMTFSVNALFKEENDGR